MVQAAQQELEIPANLKEHMQVSPQAHPEGLKETTQEISKQLQAYGLPATASSIIANPPAAPKSDGEENEASHGIFDIFTGLKNAIAGPTTAFSSSAEGRELSRQRTEDELEQQDPGVTIQVK